VVQTYHGICDVFYIFILRFVVLKVSHREAQRTELTLLFEQFFLSIPRHRSDLLDSLSFHDVLDYLDKDLGLVVQVFCNFFRGLYWLYSGSFLELVIGYRRPRLVDELAQLIGKHIFRLFQGLRRLRRLRPKVNPIGFLFLNCLRYFAHYFIPTPWFLLPSLLETLATFFSEVSTGLFDGLLSRRRRCS
jgi:hypothetical protein